MTEDDYLLAWALYGAAALGCLLVWWRMTGWMWRFLREPLRLLVAVLLGTPTVVEPARDLYAPAVAVTALDLLFKVGNNAWKGVSDLSVVALLVLAAYLGFALLRWPLELWWKGRNAEPLTHSVAEDEPTLRQLMAEPDFKTSTRSDDHGDKRLRIEPRL